VPEHVISYGKAAVPVYRIGPGDSLFAAEVTVEVFGDNFLPAYTEGDNTNVVATDSMKNFILRAGGEHRGSTLEGFLHQVGTGLLERYDQMQSLRVSGRELRFDHERGVLYDRSAGDHGTAELDLDRTAGIRLAGHRSGRVGLHLMKLRGSAFTRFVRDEYTTLPERVDRPLFLFLDVHWRYGDAADTIAEGGRHVPSRAVREVVGEVFDEFVSESIQHLVHEMATVLLARFPQLCEVSFSAQNRTRDPLSDGDAGADVRGFTDPFPAYGTIRLTSRRSI
jgi:urate oxidase